MACATGSHLVADEVKTPLVDGLLLRRISLDGSKNEEWVTGAPNTAFNMVRSDATAVYWTSVFVDGISMPAGTPSVQKKCK
jgi:hypothetical protein